MLKILVISDKIDTALLEQLQNLNVIEVSTATISQFSAKPQEYETDLVLMNPVLTKTLLLADSAGVLRNFVFSKTHQGIQKIDISDIYYFQAEHKYVTAHYNDGQLLIEDTLDSLEQDLAGSFIRIHRKILVAKQQIQQLIKEASGQYKVRLKDVSEELMVSRRKLSQVRKLLICK